MDIERSKFLVGIEVQEIGPYGILGGDTKRLGFGGETCILLFTCNRLWWYIAFGQKVFKMFLPNGLLVSQQACGESS